MRREPRSHRRLRRNFLPAGLGAVGGLMVIAGAEGPKPRARHTARRQEFGGLKSEQVKRLKDLELENSRLRKAVSDLTLDKLILQEAARGNF